MIFDIGGRQTALAIGLKPEMVDGRTSESHAGKVVERGAGKSQKDPGKTSEARKRKGGHVRNSVFKLIGKPLNFQW